MIKINLPGQGELEFKHLILDFNGTLAVDGKLLLGVKTKLQKISENIAIHILTADTFGTVKSQLSDFQIKILSSDEQSFQKADYIQKLGADECISIGNGFNDHKMIKISKLGIVVIQKEGAHSKTLIAADIVCTDINSALELLDNPNRLIATMRN